MKVAGQLGYHFPVRKCDTWKNRKLLICPLQFNRFSLSIHQNDCTVSGNLILLTDDLGNVGQLKNLQICLSKNIPTLNLADSNR